MKKNKICIVLPTYNEEHNIEWVLEEIFLAQHFLRECEIHVIVVDDKSTDLTADLVLKKTEAFRNLHLISDDKKGLGDAYRRGFAYAEEKIAPDIFFQMDSDRQHEPSLIPKFIEKIDLGYDLVVGSRFIKGSSLPGLSSKRTTLSLTANFLLRYLSGIKGVKDLTSGFRCFRSELLDLQNFPELFNRGFSFQSVLISELIRNGAKAVEIPINFLERSTGRSKLSFKDMIEFLLNLFLIRFISLHEFIKFSLVGLSGVGVNFSSYFVLTRLLEINPYLSPIFSIELSIISNFLLNDKWTFSLRKIKTSFITRFTSFHLVAGFSGLINYSIFYLSFNNFNLPDLISLLFGIIAAAISNYLFNSIFTWGK